MPWLCGFSLCNWKSALMQSIGSQDLNLCRLSKLFETTQKPCPNLDVINEQLKILLIFSGQNSRIFNPTHSPLTILADSPLNTLLQAVLTFGMRYIHCHPLENWYLLPREWYKSALVLELVKVQGVAWRLLKTGSTQYFTYQPIRGRKDLEWSQEQQWLQQQVHRWRFSVSHLFCKNCH